MVPVAVYPLFVAKSLPETMLANYQFVTLSKT